MSEHRWQGYTHQELFDQINQGPGANGSSDSIQRWRELTHALSEIDTGLAAALTAAMGGWQGEAAENARGGVRPLGEWALQAQQAAETMRQRAEQQAEYVGKARTDMPPPVSVAAEDPGPVGSLLVHLFGGQSDYEVQEAKQDAAEQRAFEVMRTYESSSTANTTSLASFAAPPQVVVDAPRSTVAGPSGSLGQQGVTISWSAPPPVAQVPTQGTAARRWMNRTIGNGSMTPTTRPTSSNSGMSGSGRPGHRRTEEQEQVDRNVTEQVGNPGGFFDEPQTLSRPVIGESGQ